MQSLSEDSMICWTADYFRKQWEDLVESRKTASLKDKSLPRFFNIVRLRRGDVLLVERQQGDGGTLREKAHNRISSRTKG